MKRKCITCGRSCSQMLKSDNYAFCCLCLPKQYYTKPQKEWICEACLKRQSNRKRHTTNTLTSKGRIICHLERYYDLSKRANYAPALLEKIKLMGPSNGEILDDLIEAGCEVIIGQAMSSHLVYGRSKKNTIIVPTLVINLEKVYLVDIPLSSNPRNYKPRNKAQVFYEMLEDHITLGGVSQ